MSTPVLVVGTVQVRSDDQRPEAMTNVLSDMYLNCITSLGGGIKTAGRSKQ